MTKLDFIMISLTGSLPIVIAYSISKFDISVYDSILIGLMVSLFMFFVFVQYYIVLINQINKLKSEMDE